MEKRSSISDQDDQRRLLVLIACRYTRPDMSLLVTGTIAIDTIQTPTDKAEGVLGGSCAYFAAAASFQSPVRVVAAVGGDWPSGHRAILESTGGFGIDVKSLADELERGTKLATILELEDEATLEQLRQVPADELLRKYEEAFSDYYHSPAIDDDLLFESTWDSLHNEGFGDRQLMIGSNYHEWYASSPADTTWDDVARKGSELLEGIDYEAALDIVSEESDPRRAMDRLISAASMLCASQHVAATMTASSSDAWMYHFTRIREDEFGASIGAYHGIEYPLLIAGTADKTEASKAFPLIERIKSFPTTIFMDGDGNVHMVYSGFSGPATGEAYTRLQTLFESTIEEILGDE